MSSNPLPLIVLSTGHVFGLGWLPKAHSTYLFGNLGEGVLIYYFVLFFFPRMLNQWLIARFARHVDPTYHICSALGEIHHRFELAARGRAA